MALTEFTGDVEVIQKLGTFPNAEDGLTDEGLKKKFDEAPVAIKKYLNETLVPEVRKLREDADSLGSVCVTITTVDGVLTADKSYAEMYKAYVDGRAVVCKMGNQLMPLVSVANYTIAFQVVVNEEYQRIVVKSDNTITQTRGQYALVGEVAKTYTVLVFPAGDGYASDETMADIQAAEEAGRTIYCMMETDAQQWIYLPKVKEQDGARYFAAVCDGVEWLVTITNDAEGNTVATVTQREVGSGGGPGKSVKHYGAKGDGATDDTAAFQAALAAERVVFVPGGTYVLSGTLVIRENCCLELAQDVVLKFTQTDADCITLLRLASLRGNHATIFVPYAFSAKVINADTADDEAVLNGDDLANSNATAVPPFTRWDPQWKMSRYVTDINICKPNANGFHYSDDGTCYGTAVYMGCSEGVADYMWGVSMSGLRIAGGFVNGIHMSCEGATWNHDMRIEAVIDGCETAVLVENTHYARLAVTIQPRPTADGTAYAKHGIKLVGSRCADLSSSRVWDWNAVNTLWTEDGEYQHIAMYGECKGLILDDYVYYAQSSYDIRDLIYTDTASNLEQMTILQEPITRWFKPVGGAPYFSDGHTEKKLITQEEMDAHFDTDVVKNFTDVLATATDTDGTIFNGTGYKVGVRFDGEGNPVESAYYCATGFIPCTPGQTIYVHDLSYATYDGFCRFCLYDADKNFIRLVSALNLTAGNYWHVGYAAMDNGFSATVNDVVDNANVAYVRFSVLKANVGANPMASIDEEIKYTIEGFLADGVKVKAKNVIGGTGGVNVTAEVGQTIIVKAVGENGVPTEWEAVDHQPRTHWVEPSVVETIMEETTLTVETDTETGDKTTATAEGAVAEMVAGEIYTVNWNGTAYECKAYDASALTETAGSIAFGRVFCMGLSDTDGGEPFLGVYYPNMGLCGFFLYDDSAEVAVSITHVVPETIHRLPKEYLPDGTPTAQPDWNAAEGEAGHMLNRTHYTEIRTLYQNDAFPPSGDMVETDFALESGKTYNVIWNGEQWTCEATDKEGAVVVGNVGIIEGEDTGEPFCIISGAGGIAGVGEPAEGLNTATLTIVGEYVEKIPDQYMPYGIAPTYYVDVVKDDSGNYTTTATPKDLSAAVKNGATIMVRKTVANTDNGTFAVSYLPLTEMVCFADGVVGMAYFFGPNTNTNAIYRIVLTATYTDDGQSAEMSAPYTCEGTL